MTRVHFIQLYVATHATPIADVAYLIGVAMDFAEHVEKFAPFDPEPTPLDPSHVANLQVSLEAATAAMHSRPIACPKCAYNLGEHSRECDVRNVLKP
jgi:hypothetical protein